MKRKRSLPFRLLLLLAVIVSVSVFLGCQFRPLMLDGACKLAKNTATEIVNGVVQSMLDNAQTDYADLILVSCNDAGVVTSLQANSAKINRIKSETVCAVRDKFAQIAVQTVTVPIGTLCGITVLSARGPSIPCRYTLSSVPTVALEYHFDGAGINQVLHSIIMVVTVPLSVTLPLQSADTEMKCSFLIGETILVGEVPDSYTNVISDPEVADDIFNYGDIG